MRRTRVQQLVETGRASALALAALRHNPERFLATVQVGITIVGTTAAAFGGSAFAKDLAPLLARVPFLAEHAETAALAIVVGLISYLSLVLGELVPKSMALRAGEVYALLMARPLKALSWIARPIVWLLTASSNMFLRPFSDRTNFMEVRISKEELQQMVEEAAESGAVHEHASEIASRALELDKLRLGAVAIPRNRIDALPLQASTEQIRQFVLEHQRSRIPVYEGAEGTLDNIVGYVSAKDIVGLAWHGKLIVLKDLLRPVKVFPESVLAVEVLRYMRRERQRLVVAVDEHGVLSGMVTFEDLVEEIVGEVFSETEDEVELFEHRPDGSLVVRGEVPIRELNRRLDLDLPEPEGVTTVAGLCMNLAGGIPHRGARLAGPDGLVFVIRDATARSVRRIQVVLPERPDEPEPVGVEA
jgi:putative hemolysin